MLIQLHIIVTNIVVAFGRRFCFIIRAELADHGRDIASVVLPDAKYKFFVVCAPEVRAERRLAELNAAGDYSQNYDEVLKDIKYRDEQDSTRATSPLVQVPEAIVIDTGKYDIEGTREFLLSHLDEEDK